MIPSESNFTHLNLPPLWQNNESAGFVPIRAPDNISGQQISVDRAGWQPMWWYRGIVSVPSFRDEGVVAQPTAALPARDLDGRLLPLWYRVPVPGEGLYAGQVTVCGPGDDAALFVGRRRLIWQGRLAKGQRFTTCFLADVLPLISEATKRAFLNSAVDLTVTGCELEEVRVGRAPDTTRRIFLMGDSTVADQTAGIPYAPAVSYAGWGQMLSRFLPAGFCVSNHAHSGLTSESFETEGHWAIVESRLSPNDLVLIQFGHNDQKLPHLDAMGGYLRQLRSYLSRIRATGALPYLVTPVARNSWTPGGCYRDFLAEYADAVRQLANQEQVPLLDLHAFSRRALETEGREESKKWFYPGDYTHTNDFGAYRWASFLADELLHHLEILSSGALPWLPAGPKSPLAPPPGLACPDEDPYAAYQDDMPLTRADALCLISTALHLFPVNGYRSPFADVVGENSFAGAVQSAVQNGLIPAGWGEDGCLHPSHPVTLKEFLTILMSGYAIRCPVPKGEDPMVQAAATGLLPDGLTSDDLARSLTRTQAAELCRQVRI